MVEDLEYKKLPGGSRGLMSRHSLHLGRDHLLWIHNAGYSEEYRRFYYKDIQAFVTSSSDRRARFSWGYGGAATLCFFLAAITKGSPFFIFIGLLGALLFAVNWLKGPSCSCMIVTAASREKLPSLCRMKPTLTALGLLQPVILSHQKQSGVYPGDAAETRTPAA